MTKAAIRVLSIDELYTLEEAIREELDESLTEILTKLNRMEQLEDFLRLKGMENLLAASSRYEPYKTARL